MDQSKKNNAIRILHIEDNKHDQIAFKRAFRESNLDCSITCFDQGEKALEWLGQQQEHPFDILVTDHGLPGITGLELCLILLERQVSFPVVLLTGIGSEEIAVEALKSGIDDYIIKDGSNRHFEFLPYTIKGLIQKHEEKRKRIKAEAALHQYEHIFSSTTDMQALLDQHYTYLAANPAYLKLLNKTADEVIGRTPADVFGETFFNATIKLKADLCLSGKDVRFQHWLDFPAIGLKYMDVAYSPYYGPDKAVRGFVVTARDISALKRAEDRIRTLSQAIEQSPVAVVITNINVEIEYVNAAFEHITGYSSAEVMGRNPRLLKSGLTPKNRYKELWQALTKGKPWQGELQNQKKNGEIFWEYAHIAPVVDESGIPNHYLAVKEDITLRKKQEEQLLHQAHFDTLTALPNRFLALDRLSQTLKEAERSKTLVAILFLDLDDFKKVNDTLGHEVGDLLLIETAERLRGTARSGDTVGRLGGDEFIVLLGGLSDVVDIRPVVKNMIEGFKAPFKISGHELILSATVGISIYPNDGNTVSSLLRKADSAMYYAKALGRNTYAFHTDAMNREVSQRLELEEKMYGALDRGEFSVFYQPVLSISSGRLVGAEALLRWQNPELGNVSPEDFIAIAEQCGLIETLGQFVLCTALEMCARWHQQQDPGFHIAVNLSPRQFRNPKMVGFIEETLHRYGLSGECLELEITEGVLMSGHQHVDEALAALSDLGVSISMDDFGTGYSSLSYLRSYPFDILKIDQSFVQDITVDQADHALINATIAMAHGLNLKVVAEGVETKAQLAYLKKQGCDYVQGYLFAKAMPEDELLEWVAKRAEVI